MNYLNFSTLSKLVFILSIIGATLGLSDQSSTTNSNTVAKTPRRTTQLYADGVSTNIIIAYKYEQQVLPIINTAVQLNGISQLNTKDLTYVSTEYSYQASSISDTTIQSTVNLSTSDITNSTIISTLPINTQKIIADVLALPSISTTNNIKPVYNIAVSLSSNVSAVQTLYDLAKSEKISTQHLEFISYIIPLANKINIDTYAMIYSSIAYELCNSVAQKIISDQNLSSRLTTTAKAIQAMAFSLKPRNQSVTAIKLNKNFFEFASTYWMLYKRFEEAQTEEEKSEISHLIYMQLKQEFNTRSRKLQVK